MVSSLLESRTMDTVQKPISFKNVTHCLLIYSNYSIPREQTIVCVFGMQFSVSPPRLHVPGLFISTVFLYGTVCNKVLLCVSMRVMPQAFLLIVYFDVLALINKLLCHLACVTTKALCYYVTLLRTCDCNMRE
jgi:hypothetical protein